MTPRQAIEREIDRILSGSYGGSESAEWKHAQRLLDILEETLTRLEAADQEINAVAIEDLEEPPC